MPINVACKSRSSHFWQNPNYLLKTLFSEYFDSSLYTICTKDSRELLRLNQNLSFNCQFNRFEISDLRTSQTEFHLPKTPFWNSSKMTNVRHKIRALKFKKIFYSLNILHEKYQNTHTHTQFDFKPVPYFYDYCKICRRKNINSSLQS